MVSRSILTPHILRRSTNLSAISTMERYRIPLLDESGRTIGYGDRWWTHRVRDGPDGPILGQRHAGITIVFLDQSGRILIQHRRHRIFDKVWSLSGDTHPRKYGSRRVESLPELREDVLGRTSESRSRTGPRGSAYRILRETLATQGTARTSYCTF